MGRQAERSRKKVSVTLAPDLVKRVVEYPRDAGLPSFSAALEALLWRHLMEEKEKANYLSMSEEERAEQKAWARFGTEQSFSLNREE